MSHILSGDTHPTSNPFKKGFRMFNQLDKFFRLTIVAFVLFLMATPIIVSNRFDIRQRAAGETSMNLPVGDLPGWQQIFLEDFNTDVPIGSFPGSTYDAKWDVYPDGWTDTSRNGRYTPSRVLSVRNGVLDYWVHTENGIHMVSAPEPNNGTSQLYGRYSVRFRSDSLPNYKVAWLLWPQSEVWPRDGEIDFPEGDLDGQIDAFMHRQNGTAGGDQDYYGSGIPMSPDWHIATTEWSPNRLAFILDGRTIGVSTSRVPNTPMRWVLQTETALNGDVPSDSTQGHLEVDWVAIWAYSPGTQPSNPTPTTTQPSLTPTQTPTNVPSTPTPAPGTTSFPTGTFIEAEAGQISYPFTSQNGYISQTTNNQSNATAGGLATYRFSVPSSGLYTLEAIMNAPNTESDSISVNIDAQPTDPYMVWDTQLTSGFQTRRLTWRGTGGSVASAQEFNPKTFQLTQGVHTLYIRGREANILIDKIRLVELSATIPTNTVPTATPTRIPTATPTTIPTPTRLPTPTPTSPIVPTRPPDNTFSVGTFVEAEAGRINTPFITVNGNLVQPTNSQGNAGTSGLATYLFSAPSTGIYTVDALVNAPNTESDSLIVNIDAEPADPTMVWDIQLTNGFESRRLSWRGNGTPTANNQQYNPKLFYLTPGLHTLYIRGREANTQVDKLKITLQPTGLLGTYFDEKNLSGKSMKRLDPTINFSWLLSSPLNGIGADTFSVRWTGYMLSPTSEQYTFTTTSDDGARLWVNNQLLIDQWNDHNSRDHSNTLQLEAGKLYPITMEFYDNTLQATAKLWWSTPRIPKQIVPNSNLFPN